MSLGLLASKIALICCQNSIFSHEFHTTTSLALPVVPGIRDVNVVRGAYFLFCSSSCESPGAGGRRRPKPTFASTSLTTRSVRFPERTLETTGLFLQSTNRDVSLEGVVTVATMTRPPLWHPHSRTWRTCPTAPQRGTEQGQGCHRSGGRAHELRERHHPTRPSRLSQEGGSPLPHAGQMACFPQISSSLGPRIETGTDCGRLRTSPQACQGTSW